MQYTSIRLGYKGNMGLNVGVAGVNADTGMFNIYYNYYSILESLNDLTQVRLLTLINLVP